MDTGFEKALEFIIKSETVYVKHHYGELAYAISENVKFDDGGLTKFGVDQRSHPDEDIENLTYERAVEIYRDEYWLKSHANELPYPLSLVQIDGAVNTGVGQQTKFLQRVCNVEDDGAYGPNTRKAALALCELLGPVEVSMRVMKLRNEFYHLVVETHPEKEKFMEGWMNRMANLQKIVASC